MNILFLLSHFKSLIASLIILLKILCFCKIFLNSFESTFILFPDNFVSTRICFSHLYILIFHCLAAGSAVILVIFAYLLIFKKEGPCKWGDISPLIILNGCSGHEVGELSGSSFLG